MIILILILGGICTAIACVGYYSIRHEDLGEYRDAIVIVCALLCAAVVIFGIFAFDTGSATKTAKSVDKPSAQADPALSTGQTATSLDSSLETQGVVKPTLAIAYQPGEIIRDCETCPEMVVVPAGKIETGEPGETADTLANEQPQNRTYFPGTFAVGRYEIKVREFKQFANETNFQVSGPCNTDGVGGKNADFRNPGMTQGAEHPVVCVSANDAILFVEWLSKKTGQRYSLLSEAQWEYARRGETGASQKPTPVDLKNLHTRGNIRSNTWIASTMEVGRFDSNRFLLFDMTGNAGEWTADCWVENGGAPRKDAGPVLKKGDCQYRPVRGGSWDEHPRDARPSSRRKMPADARDWRIGFRIMRHLHPEPRTTNLSK